MTKVYAPYATKEDYFMGEAALCGWSEIARIFGVSARTMQRKRAALLEAGVIFYMRRGRPPRKRVLCVAFSPQGVDDTTGRRKTVLNAMFLSFYMALAVDAPEGYRSGRRNDHPPY